MKRVFTVILLVIASLGIGLAFLPLYQISETESFASLISYVQALPSSRNWTFILLSVLVGVFYLSSIYFLVKSLATKSEQNQDKCFNFGAFLAIAGGSMWGIHCLSLAQYGQLIVGIIIALLSLGLLLIYIKKLSH